MFTRSRGLGKGELKAKKVHASKDFPSGPGVRIPASNQGAKTSHATGQSLSPTTGPQPERGLRATVACSHAATKTQHSQINPF